MRAQVITVTIAAVALGIAASPAAASAPAENATEQKSAITEKKVCRWIDPPTGSLLRERICLTADQWKKVDKLLAE